MKIHIFLAVLVACAFLPVTGRCADTTRSDQSRINEILFSVLDTLKAEVDSSAFSNSMLTYPIHLRRKWETQLIAEGYGLPPASALYRGSDMATRDLMHGRFALKYRGEMIVLMRVDSLSWRTGPIYEYNLRSMFGIELEWVPGGPGWKWYELFEEGYNKVAIPVLNALFQCDVQSKAHDAILETIKRDGKDHQADWLVHP
jgi:hypothetical protein